MADIEKALKPSRDSWFKRAMGLFDRATVDEAVWTELEELLISADVGFGTTEKLLERVKQRAKEEKFSEGAKVREALQQEMVKILTLDGSPSAPVSARDRRGQEPTTSTVGGTGTIS